MTVNQFPLSLTWISAAEGGRADSPGRRGDHWGKCQGAEQRAASLPEFHGIPPE